MNFTFIHGLGVCQYLCLIIAEYCLDVRIYHNLFIHLPDDGHFGALMDKSALNSLKNKRLCGHLFLFLLNKYFAVGFLVVVCFNLVRHWQAFSKLPFLHPSQQGYKVHWVRSGSYWWHEFEFPCVIDDVKQFIFASWPAMYLPLCWLHIF